MSEPRGAARGHDPKQLAKDVARHMDARRRRRKLFLVALLIAAIVAAVLYLGFGRGWGFGKGSGPGKGSGTGPSVAALVDAGPSRCEVRVTSEGIAVDGAKATTAEAVDACKKLGAAEVVVTGDARQGAWDKLKAAFETAGVPVFLKTK